MKLFARGVPLATGMAVGLISLMSFAQTTNVGSTPIQSGTSSSPGQASGGPSANSYQAASNGQVMSYTGPAGTYLTDGNGKSLYAFLGDSGGTSSCYGACTQVWIPYLIASQNAYSASGAAVSGDLGSIQRTDGTWQLTYRGEPLYYYSGDQNPGNAYGEGLNSYGNYWSLVSPTGALLFSAGATGASGASGASGAAVGATGASAGAGSSAGVGSTGSGS